jgi:transcriptional regulator with XRE-family HTH domain
MNKSSATVFRIAQALPEARFDHGLSQSEFARLSGVSRATIAKAERGEQVDPLLLVRLGATMLVLDTYREPRFDVDVMLREGLRVAS